MRWWHSLRTRLRSLLRRSDAEAKMNDELRFHVEMEIEQAIRRGLSPEDARRTVALQFGGAEAIREECREARGWSWAERIARDTRLAWRSLRKSPAFTLTAVITLALGIGVNTAVFSIVDTVLLRPLPYPASGRLVAVWQYTVKDPAAQGTCSPAIFRDYRAGAPAFESLAMWAFNYHNLTNTSRPERLLTLETSASYFDVLRVRPSLGRAYTAAEETPGRHRVVVLTHEFWERRYGADPALLNHTVRIDNEPYEVIGILPRGFVPPPSLGQRERPTIYLPATFPPDVAARYSEHLVSVVGRLRTAATLARAQAELDAVSLRVARSLGPEAEDWRTGAAPLQSNLVRRQRLALEVLVGAVALILLIACVNLANLTLVRGTGRRRETALRLALGAGRARVTFELFVESVLLATFGCLLGAAIGEATLRLLLWLAPDGIPRLDQATLDGRVLAFTALAGFGSTLLFGLLPAWQSARGDAASALQQGARQTAAAHVLRWRAALMTAEVALSLILLTGAGLLIKSFVKVASVPLGFDSDRILAMTMMLSPTRYDTQQKRAAFFEQLEERVTRLPGVAGVAVASRFPLRGGWETGVIKKEGALPHGDSIAAMIAAMTGVQAQAVSPGFFSTLRIPIFEGRGFTRADRDGAEPVVVINRALARILWPGQSSLGKRLHRGFDTPWLTVIGVVADLHLRGQDHPTAPQIYVPIAQTESYPVHVSDFAIRSAGDPQLLLKAVETEVWALDPDQPVTSVAPLSEVVSDWIAPRRFQALLVGLFAALALVLALVGIYGVIAYAVAQRTPEIAIRLALGATRGRVARHVLGQALRVTALGLALGLAGAAALTRSLESLLFEVKPGDPATFAAVALLLASTAALATCGPVLRATRVNPCEALRYE